MMSAVDFRFPFSDFGGIYIIFHEKTVVFRAFPRNTPVALSVSGQGEVWWGRRGDAQNEPVYVETYYRSLVKNSFFYRYYLIMFYKICVYSAYCMVVCGINRPRRLCILQYSIIPTGNNYTRVMNTIVSSHKNFPLIWDIADDFSTKQI